MKVITACPLDCPDSCSLEVTVELGKIVDIDAAPIGEQVNPLTAGWICKKVKHHALRVYSKERNVGRSNNPRGEQNLGCDQRIWA